MRLIDGNTVLTDALFDTNTQSWICHYPMVVDTVRIKGGEATTAFPYFPGCKSHTISLSNSFVIYTLEAASFYKKLFGTAIMKYAIQDMILDYGGELTDYHKTSLQAFEIDILSKYGMIEHSSDDEDNKKQIDMKALH